MKKILSVAISVTALLFSLIPVSASASTESGPLLSDDTTINNQYFNIVSGASVSAVTAKKNVEGFNAAFQYVADQNISTVKLQKAHYTVDTSMETQYHTKPTIDIPGGLVLDMNGATIQQTKTSSPYYRILTVRNQTDVVICNGTLRGDRMTHDYNTIPSSHEHGFGIRIMGGKNVTVSSMEIYDMTGDAVHIGGSNDKLMSNGCVIPEKIVVKNNKLYQCRRQGISVVASQGGGVLIDNCQINQIGTSDGIKGTKPMACIDLEASMPDWPVENVTITNCVLEASDQQGDGNLAIDLNRNAKYNRIHNNTKIKGIIWFTNGYGTQIFQNRLVDGKINGVKGLEVSYLFEDNQLENYQVLFKGV